MSETIERNVTPETIEAILSSVWGVPVKIQIDNGGRRGGEMVSRVATAIALTAADKNLWVTDEFCNAAATAALDVIDPTLTEPAIK